MLNRLRLRTWWPWAILLGGLTLTLVRWQDIRQSDRARLEALNAIEMSALVNRLELRISALKSVLKGASSYLAREPQPTRSEWREYVKGLGVLKSQDGLQGMSFVTWIPRTDLPTHIQQMKAQGFPEYTVIPGGPLPPDPAGLSSIVYLEPMNERNQRAFGRDMWADPVRREAMSQARDTGDAILSRWLTLYQEGATDRQPGVVLYAPVYRAHSPVDTVNQRRTVLLGWATLVIRMGDFLEPLLQEESTRMGLRLFEGDPSDGGTLLFDSDATGHLVSFDQPHLRTLEALGRTWTLQIQRKPEVFPFTSSRFRVEVLIGGILVTLVTWGMALLILDSERRARSLADARGEEVLATEAQFQALFECAPLGMAIVDTLGGRFLAVNPRLGQILGYSLEDLLELTFLEVTHPDHRQADANSVRALAAGEVAEIQKEKRYLHQDGHEIWVRLSIVGLPLAPGESPRHLALVEDISELRWVTETIKLSEEKFRSLFELSPDPVTVSRLSDGLVVLANQAWCDLTGFSKEEVLGSPSPELAVWSRHEARATLMAELRETGSALARESSFQLRDGTECVLVITAKAIELGGEAFALTVGKDVTDRVQSERALKESEARWQFALDGAGDGVWDWRAGVASMFMSRGYKAMLGYGADELVEGTFAQWIEWIHTEDRERVLGLVNAYLEHPTATYQIEYRLRCKDGSYLWVLARGKAVAWDATGRPTRMLGTHSDITERKAAEEALRLSEARLRLLSDQLPDSFLYQYISTPGEAPRFTYVSAGVERLCGVKVEEALKDAGVLLSQMDPAMLPVYLEVEEASARNLSPFLLDFRNRRADGEWRWFRVRSVPRTLPDGKVIWEGICTDNTDRQLSRILLEESEARFRGVVESAGDAIFLHDVEGRIFLCNAAACSSTGYAMEELLQLSVGDLDSGFHESANLQFVRSLQAGQQASIQARHRRKDGTSFPVEIRTGLLKEGEPRLILAVVRNLSEREQVLESDLRARKAESLVLMAGGIAHDFNNLFQALQGYLEVIGMQVTGNPLLTDPLGRALGVLNRAVSLSWKMLDFSGHSFVRLEPLNLETWLPAYLATLQVDLPPALNLDLTCDPVPAIHADPSKLEQVIKAALDNALEATDSLAASVRLRLFVDFGGDRPGPGSPGIWPLRRPDLPATVCLEITDEGPGVPPEKLDLICDPFYTTRQPGRGLGLSVVVGILTAHRAGLHIFNREAGGLILRMHFRPAGA